MSDIWTQADSSMAREDARPWPERVLDALNAQQTRLFLWLPVCLAAGSAVYYVLPREPAGVVLYMAAAMAAGLVRISRHNRWAIAWLAAALVLTGFAAAKLRTDIVASRQLAATTGKVHLTGWVREVAMSGPTRAKLVIDVDRMSRIRRSAWPEAAQVTLYRLKRPPRVGEYIQASVRLYPLITPVAPGAFDYGRTLWFRGIGATGRGVLAGENELTAPQAGRTSARSVIADLRTEIGTRIHTVLPRDLAGFAEALITGNRAHISRQMRDRLSIAGLAHVLAISGLHMSLVAGGLFWLVRAVLALIPGAALRLPIKKYAAVAALLAGAGYLALSGGAVSTQRAFIMLSVMFVAVLFDRPAISLRNLAIAATIIVLTTPEAVLSAGFQMSFLAVMGLVATYESLRDARAHRPVRPYPTTALGRIVRWAWRFIAATALTTLIASVFTGLPAAYHFNRIAPLGVIANVLALPVVTFIVMPMAVAATLLMPFGLEAWPLWAMGEGLTWVNTVADRVVGLPHASIAVPTLGSASAICFAAATLWLCLWRGGLRGFGLLPAVLAVVLALPGERPDILIERSGKNVAVRNADGELTLASARRARFVVGKWLLTEGDAATPSGAAQRPGWQCSANRCKATVKGQTVVYLREQAGRPVDCGQADIVISDFPLRGACAGSSLRIDRFDLWRAGAHAIFVDGNKIRTATAAQQRGHRPWVTTPVARRKIQLVPTEYSRTIAQADSRP